MKKVDCTFENPNQSCSHCGETLTPAKYYTATEVNTRYKPRRKSPGYTVTSYKNIALHTGGLCVPCGGKRCIYLMKRAGLALGISAIIAAALICVGNMVESVSPDHYVVHIAYVLATIALIVCGFKIVRIIKFLLIKAKLKDESKFSEKKLSQIFAALYTSQMANSLLVFPITKYKYLTQEHKS